MADTEDPCRVLAVDDDEMVLETYGIWLGDAYDLTTATSGEAALALFDDGEAFDVVLLDRLMPGTNGDEVLHALRERGVDAQVGIVSAVDPDTEVLGLPFDAYVEKPLDGDGARAAVDTLAARRELPAEVRTHRSLAERVLTVESNYRESELADDERYRTLVDRFETLSGSVPDDRVAVPRSELVTDVTPPVGSTVTLADETDGV